MTSKIPFDYLKALLGNKKRKQMKLFTVVTMIVMACGSQAYAASQVRSSANTHVAKPVFRSNADLIRQSNQGRMLTSKPGAANPGLQVRSNSGNGLISNGMGSIISRDGAGLSGGAMRR